MLGPSARTRCADRRPRVVAAVEGLVDGVNLRRFDRTHENRRRHGFALGCGEDDLSLRCRSSDFSGDFSKPAGLDGRAPLPDGLIAA
jgi:hypothetical protein